MQADLAGVECKQPTIRDCPHQRNREAHVSIALRKLLQALPVGVRPIRRRRQCDSMLEDPYDAKGDLAQVHRDK